jgi:protein SCO1/2
MIRNWLLTAAIFLSATASAYDTNVTVTGLELPNEFKGVGVEEHLGQNIDLNTPFTNEKGQEVPLRTFFKDDKPVLMAMVYYTCPALCNYHLNGLTEAMKQLKWSAGADYQFVAVSMKAEETPEVAAKKKHNYLKVYSRPGGEEGWHFLVGRQDNVSKLAKELGFKYNWMPEKKEFAHVSVAYVITPAGKISRYLHGIQVDPKTLKMSLLEASSGKIGNVVEQAMMFCFQFNPVKNKYTLYAWNIMRIGAAVMVLLMGALLISVWWRGQLQHRNRT